MYVTGRTVQPRTHRLPGTISETADPVTAAGGPELDRRRIELPSSIKTTGEHTVTVRVHPEVTAQLRIEVVAA